VSADGHFLEAQLVVGLTGRTRESGVKHRSTKPNARMVAMDSDGITELRPGRLTWNYIGDRVHKSTSHQLRQMRFALALSRATPHFDWNTRGATFPSCEHGFGVLYRSRQKWAQFRYPAV
jgi:hypothetical protein